MEAWLLRVFVSGFYCPKIVTAKPPCPGILIFNVFGSWATRIYLVFLLLSTSYVAQEMTQKGYPKTPHKPNKICIFMRFIWFIRLLRPLACLHCAISPFGRAYSHILLVKRLRTEESYIKSYQWSILKKVNSFISEK